MATKRFSTFEGVFTPRFLMTSKNSLRFWRRDELLSSTKNQISGGAKRHEIGERPALLAQGSRFQGNFLQMAESEEFFL